MDIAKVMVDLASCLCQGIKDCRDIPDVCYCGLIPGAQYIDMTGADCDPAGQAWVRLGQAFPSARVGVPDLTPGNCGAGVGTVIEVGVMRWFPIQAEPLTDEEVLEATVIQIRDMEIMREAILCCPSLDKNDFILNTYTPLGPLGGQVGGQWTLTAGLL